MSAARMAYRTRQLWRTLTAAPDAGDIERARHVLTDAQWDLFSRLQPSEQAHSLQIFTRLEAQGETNRDLLGAALLHDIGKSRFPLKVWERVAIVLGKAFFPGQARKWGVVSGGEQEMNALRRPFIIAEMHPAWGAELVEQAGAGVLFVNLVRRHQEKILEICTLEDRLLAKLQAADDES